MISNECKDLCRTSGLAVERIICLTDYYDDTVKQNEKKIFYDPKYECKDKIIADMKEASKEIVDTLKQISIGDHNQLYQMFGISLIEYADNLSRAVFAERYMNDDTKNKAKALETIIIDMIYLELTDEIKYKRIAEGD